MQYLPFTSAVEPSFWHALAKHKLEVLRLSDAPIAVAGSFVPGRLVKTAEDAYSSLPACLSLEGGSLDPLSLNLSSVACRAPGTLKNANTIEEFKAMDKPALFNAAAAEIWASITSHRALTDPRELLRFVLVTFADLKKFKFYYWFGFPALTVPLDVAVVAQGLLCDAVSEKDLALIGTAFRTHAPSLAFLLSRPDDRPEADLEYLPLARIADPDIRARTSLLVVVSDPSSLADNPGWPVRNLLIALAHAGVIACTLVLARHDLTIEGNKDAGMLSRHVRLTLANLQPPESDAALKSVGWERHPNGKLAPRMVDLRHMMDPQRLADEAVHLNLKLMKWRVLPELDLAPIASAKCLLLGAGTLGCYVARGLVAWGVRHVTFVDSGKVSFSNPVRQPLFTFADCLDGGKDKAVAAADRLKEVLPSLNTTGHVMGIPMPGHPVLNEAEFLDTMHTLEALITSHDAIFLLMDSRESRWLPTMLGRFHNKLVINAALGFDSYVVMRHSDKLGCYYCNDVVAPTDSLSDRTLDQMCTVSRPGLAAIAGANAVELLASIMNHPERNAAAANSQGVLGKVPHQLRGFLHNHETLLISGQAYDKCTACSDRILAAYRERRIDFVRDVCNQPAVLEKLTGLDAMRDEVDADLAWADEGADEDDDF
ncbi:Autophagy protein 7 [Blastocladiella emersonii ATCC 22665]|nr:Autophagy protein 7 [Blastocladiella emersonii ATCC 22665]